MKALLSMSMSLFAAVFPIRAGTENETRANELAEAVFKASGGENWDRVRSIQFRFNVDQDKKTVVSAKHEWNVSDGIDKVTWGRKTVTVNVHTPATDADVQAAYRRWVNDSYWLLMPLKLRDPGATLSYKGRQEVAGSVYEVLHLQFADVGLTPGDQYHIYVDPETKLVRRWDYMPNPEKTVSGTWETYKDFGGLKLSTDHQFGARRIWFSDIAVRFE